MGTGILSVRFNDDKRSKPAILRQELMNPMYSHRSGRYGKMDRQIKQIIWMEKYWI